MAYLVVAYLNGIKSDPSMPDCLSGQRLRRSSRLTSRNPGEPFRKIGLLRGLPNEPVAEIVQCGEPTQ